jgi:hypothetical protein
MASNSAKAAAIRPATCGWRTLAISSAAVTISAPNSAEQRADREAGIVDRLDDPILPFAQSQLAGKLERMAQRHGHADGDQQARDNVKRQDHAR